jgi:hypothetical protein
MDWEDDINDLFEHFVEEVNEIPFTREYEHTPEFRLNQSIINNAYLLRRTIELYPQEQRNFIRSQRRLRRSTELPRVSSQHLHQDLPPLNIPSRIRITSFSDDENESLSNTRYRQPQRNHDYDYDLMETSVWPIGPTNSPIWSPFENIHRHSLANNLTDTVLNSLFTNFNTFMEQNLQNLQDLEDVKVTLTEDEFNKLDIVTDKELINGKQCNICLEDLTEDELNKPTLIQLKCNHIYHKECIKEWLTKQSTKCPSCRNCCRTSTNSE